MRLLFANARPSPPFTYDGGSIQTIATLIEGLSSRGWQVEQLCTFPHDNFSLALKNAKLTCCPENLRQLNFGAESTRSQSIVYSTSSALIEAVHTDKYEERLQERLEKFSPDLLITWLAGSGSAVQLGADMGVPTLLRILDVSNKKGYPYVSTQTAVVANSPIAAAYASQFYGRPVGYILPPIDHAAYVSPDPHPEYVTYINPQKCKGLFLFREIVDRLPEVRFLVICGWSWSKQSPEEIEAVSQLRNKPNVSVMNSTWDIKEVYKHTKLLLVPSRWPESWGRVVQEAQANGIPVLVSNRGCLPFNVGEGGMVLKYDTPDIWAKAISWMLCSKELSSLYSQRALDNTSRFRFDTVMDLYERLFDCCAKTGFDPDTLSRPAAVHAYYADSVGHELKIDKKLVEADEPYDFSEPDYP